MTEKSANRHELGEFLRSRRAKLSPEECGLKGGGRRRTAGLRREEIASLAGVSPSWYTKLEQGRDISISQRFLRHLADALKLNAADRMQLFLLGVSELSEALTPDTEEVIPAVQRMIDAMPSPAIIMTARMDYLGCNEAARAAFGEIETFLEFSRVRRNILVGLFLSEPTRLMLSAWLEFAHYQVAVFRAAYNRHAQAAAFKLLVDELTSESLEFREIWNAYEVPPKRILNVLYKDRAGVEISSELSSLYVDVFDNIRIDVYTPLTATK